MENTVEVPGIWGLRNQFEKMVKSTQTPENKKRETGERTLPPCALTERQPRAERTRL